MARLEASKDKAESGSGRKLKDAAGKQADARKSVYSTFLKLARMVNRNVHIDWRELDDNLPVYAVGDVHGMAHLLDRMLDLIEDDSAQLGVAAHVVFLGDAINRGPNSRQVIERLVGGPRRPGDEWLVLRGNHEQALLDGLRDDEDFEKFLQKGGVQTLQSYGISRKHMTRKDVRTALPKDHVAFLGSLPLTCRTRSHLFVHAGVRAGRSLKQQAAKDLLTLREPFFAEAAKLPWTVVHGHTPSAGRPVVAKGRIGVDTGACMTGVLTAAVIQNCLPPRFLTAVAEV
ncbi:MAG: serine/threonine protein phosphatase [Hyphomicrobiales bacterium]|nr:serine/threonine protein phosphatase [Hyphomicrobiales bacterium]